MLKYRIPQIVTLTPKPFSLKATKTPAKVNILRGVVSSKLLDCWTTKIRTWTNRTKTCCATITP